MNLRRNKIPTPEKIAVIKKLIDRGFLFKHTPRQAQGHFTVPTTVFLVQEASADELHDIGIKTLNSQTRPGRVVIESQLREALSTNQEILETAGHLDQSSQITPLPNVKAKTSRISSR